MNKTIFSAITTIFISLNFLATEKAFSKTNDTQIIQSGPMLGYSEMREVMLWVQTKKSAKVKIVYWDKDNIKDKYSTKEIKTFEKSAFIVKLIANNVSPGKKYDYEVYVDGKKVDRGYKLQFQTPELWQWRKDPTNFTVAFGSCNYVNEAEFDRPGKPYGGNMEIFTSIYQKHPDIMLWGGDNVYLREADWYSKTGMLKRYTHTRSAPEIQPLLATAHNYAIWDDHDFGPNDANVSFRDKDKALNVFKLFWGNPTYGLKEAPSTFTKFEWGDAEFFLLDNRMFRTPDKKISGEKTTLGKEQLNWLVESLLSSKATFKMIVMGGQFINSFDGEFIETYERYKEEKKYILDTLEQQKIKGVVFLTGDRHQSELSVLKRNNDYPLYDLTVSPFTAMPYDSSKEQNKLRVDGTVFVDRNFSILSFRGTKKDRELFITIFDKDGKEVWNRTIKASELK
ncbi:MAG: alkaline phosphatase D family protein [Cyanobacteriota bacterium]